MDNVKDYKSIEAVMKADVSRDTIWRRIPRL